MACASRAYDWAEGVLGITQKAAVFCLQARFQRLCVRFIEIGRHSRSFLTIEKLGDRSYITGDSPETRRTLAGHTP